MISRKKIRKLKAEVGGLRTVVGNTINLIGLQTELIKEIQAQVAQQTVIAKLPEPDPWVVSYFQ
jgi:hypothetical protein